MPPRLRAKLGPACPPLLWLRGEPQGLPELGVGIAGGRFLSPQEARFSSAAGKACARAGLTVFSGGASGADSFGACGALMRGGRAFHFLPGGAAPSQAPILCRNPKAPPFDRLEALSRNRWIYAASEAVVLVSSRLGEGGSWAGAIAAKRSRLTRLLVYLAPQPSPGNLALARMGVESVRNVSELEAVLAGVLRPLGLAI